MDLMFNPLHISLDRHSRKHLQGEGLPCLQDLETLIYPGTGAPDLDPLGMHLPLLGLRES